MKSASASEAYRKAYRSSLDPHHVLDFLLLSRSFPRSVLFCLRRAESDLARLRGGDGTGNRPTRPERLVGPAARRPGVPRRPRGGRRRSPPLPRAGAVRRAPGRRGRRPAVLPLIRGGRPVRPRLPPGGVTDSAMRFDIRYRTRFEYEQLVRESQNELRSCPASDEHQQLISYRVSTTPSSRVLSASRLLGHARRRLRHPRAAPVPRGGRRGVGRDPQPIVGHGDGATGRAARRPASGTATASTSRRPGTRPGATASSGRRRASSTWRATTSCRLVLAIHRFVAMALTYEPGSTYVGVEVEQVLASGRGVCQDFAHLAVSLCRAAGRAGSLRVGLPVHRGRLARRRHRRRVGARADPCLVRGGGARVRVDRPRPDQPPAGGVAPREDRARPRLRRRPAAARRLCGGGQARAGGRGRDAPAGVERLPSRAPLGPGPACRTQQQQQ